MTTEPERQSNRQIDRQTVSRQPCFLIPRLGFYVAVSFLLSLVSICVMRKRKFSEYKITFITFQTLALLSYNLLSPGYAFHYIHSNFIYQPKHELRFVLSRSHHHPLGPQMADENFLCTPETLKKIINTATRRPFWFYCLFRFILPLLASRFFRQFCHCSVVVVAVVVVVSAAFASTPTLHTPFPTD